MTLNTRVFFTSDYCARNIWIFGRTVFMLSFHKDDDLMMQKLKSNFSLSLSVIIFNLIDINTLTIKVASLLDIISSYFVIYKICKNSKFKSNVLWLSMFSQVFLDAQIILLLSIDGLKKKHFAVSIHELEGCGKFLGVLKNISSDLWKSWEVPKIWKSHFWKKLCSTKF